MSTVREQIHVALETALRDGIPAATVARNLDREILFIQEVSELPHININEGSQREDDEASDQYAVQQDLDITINMTVTATEPSGLSDALDQLYRDIYKLLDNGTQTLGGLAQEINVHSYGDVVTSHEGHQPIIGADLEVSIMFTHSRSNPEVAFMA